MQTVTVPSRSRQLARTSQQNHSGKFKKNILLSDVSQPRHANLRVSGVGIQSCVTWWPRITLQMLLAFVFIQLMTISTTANISEWDPRPSGWCYFISSSIWLLFYWGSEKRTPCPKPHSWKWQAGTETQAGNCGSSQRQTAPYQRRSILTPLPGA